MVIKPTCGFVRLIVNKVSILHLHATVACVLVCESHGRGMWPLVAQTCVSCADLGVIREGAWPQAKAAAAVFTRLLTKPRFERV